MCDSYGRALLRVAVAQICQALGWDSVQVTACDILTDVLNRYIEQLTRGCHRYSELYGRTDPVLDDLGQAFKLMGISLSELEDYIHNLEPIGFAHQIPAFPVSKNNVLQFPQPGTKILSEEREYIPEYMPPLISSQEEEEEEQVPTDGGTSAEAMQVPLEEEEEDMEEEEAVNDENFLGKRPLESPDSVDLPVAKRARTAGCKMDSPDGVLEPREPLSMINSQRVPPVLSPVPPPDHSDSQPLSPEPPMLAPIPKPSTPKALDSKVFTSKVKSKISSSPIQKPKSPKGSQLALSGSPIRSPKASLKSDKKSPIRTKSPKSPKSPKVPANVSHSTAKNETPNRTPLSVCNSGSEKLGKENIHTKQPHTSTESEKPNVLDTSPKKLPVPDKSIDDSIDAVIARACAEREPDPFEFSSGSESEGETFTSPKRLTISESSPRMLSLSSSFSRGSATPVSSSGPTTSTNVSWTLDDSINEVVRKASLGTPPSVPASIPYLSSPSASPPTPEPLLKLYEERTKHASSSDVKKKLKKEIKMKIKKKEKEKLKDKDREKKEKGKDKEKNKDKEKEANKESKIFFKEFGKEHEKDAFKFRIKDFDDSDVKVKHKDGSFKKDKEKHKEKKKDKEKGKKDKEKNKDKDKHKVKAPSASLTFVPKEVPLPLFSTPSSVKTQCALPAVFPMVPERLFEEKSKEKDKKKDKKEKKKKKDKDKDRMKEKEKKEKEKKEREKEKEKDKHKHEKAKAEAIIPAPSPVIPRLTLRVGAGQDKIVISKVVPVTEPKPSPPAGHPKTPPPPSPAPPLVHIAPPLTPAPLPPPSAAPSPAPALPTVSPAATGTGAGASKTPVRSVVTETVSTYVIRDEWGNQIWICPGCKKADDGSPMIGCDDCDDWYHWPCVGITAAPPDEVQWFCPKCINKKKEKKHKRKKSRAH
ncbi:transcription initiation factor TFIID subunit 3 isoform X2 [Heptranchias perlo]|uniref:transcription initiation factor TFIID subunit 3 isoform X2 n=1 Tax=Heptranchias perlo TaxID=212740 RepID=UPI00355989D7